jgi:3'(2'), 5'-bisphosphate nucleotidase
MQDTADAGLRARVGLAAAIAARAGERLLALRASGRWQGDLLGDVADQAADGHLQGAVRACFPGDAVRSEETPDAAGAAWDDGFGWILDPLDGTREYAQGGDDFAVHVGIVHDGAVAGGAVALPAIGRVLVAGLGEPAVHGAGGSWPRALAPAAEGPGRLRLAVSRSHTPGLVRRLAPALDAELVPCGSVGFKVALLLFGRADVYVHQRGLREWDTCAPEAVARAAGWAVCRLDGTPLRYGRPDPRVDELLVCRPALLPRLLPLVAAAR